LTKAMFDRGPAGEIIRKAGVMAIVITGGDVMADDPISIKMPPEPHQPLVPV
jgi:MOSC domain-containing protein YiiM